MTHSIMHSIAMLCFNYAERHQRALYTECHYAESRYTECRYSECRYAKCRYAECRYAKCRYAECLHPECRGTLANKATSLERFL
jgi:hypothetical protein